MGVGQHDLEPELMADGPSGCPSDCPQAVLNTFSGEVWSCRLMTRRGGMPCRDRWLKALRKGWWPEGCERREAPLESRE